jgi:hypothetical protein
MTTFDGNPSVEYGGPREEKNSSFVLLCGLATTAVALFGVYILDRVTEDFHIMGWYANYILPVGAIIVGVAASSGYGLASWFSGIKITRGLLWSVLGLQLLAYFVAQYIEFSGMHLVHRSTGQRVGFLEYFDLMARSFSWKQDNGQQGQPLGVWGYAFRLLEIAGFAGGGLIIPAVMRSVPYCQSCQRYMRTKQLVVFPGSVPARKVKKSDTAATAAYEAEQLKAYEDGKQTWEKLKENATNARGTEFRTKLTELESGTKPAMKLPRRFSLKLVCCKRCSSGWLQVHELTGQGKQLKTADFGRLDLTAEFVRSVWTDRGV